MGVQPADASHHTLEQFLGRRSRGTALDPFNAAYMEAQGLTVIYNWDNDFDSIEGITTLRQRSDAALTPRLALTTSLQLHTFSEKPVIPLVAVS
jgi:hypothetical protein